MRLDSDADILQHTPNVLGKMPSAYDTFDQFGVIQLHIWELAKKGNIQKIRSLLMGGHFDVNE